MVRLVSSSRILTGSSLVENRIEQVRMNQVISELPERIALMLGCLTRVAAGLGVVMLALYYVAHPTLFAAEPAGR